MWKVVLFTPDFILWDPFRLYIVAPGPDFMYWVQIRILYSGSQFYIKEFKYTRTKWKTVDQLHEQWQGSSWPWWYRSWIYNYLCNQCLSPLMFRRVECKYIILNLTTMTQWNVIIWRTKNSLTSCLCSVCLMEINATSFNTISFISWWWVLLVEKTGG
jgi:hypothetical protein